MKDNYSENSRKLSLCNTCACGANDCEWMSDLIPVKDWKAKTVKYPSCPKGNPHTYHVIKCPKFVPCRLSTSCKSKTCRVCGKLFYPKSNAQKRCLACISAGRK